jgi:hypothetical protein
MNATSNPIFRFAFGMVALLSWQAIVGVSQEATATMQATADHENMFGK